MKSEKYEPPSERQHRRMKQLGLEPYSGMTGHRASQMINEAVVKLGLARGERLSPVDSADLARKSIGPCEPDYIVEFQKNVASLLGDIKDPVLRQSAEKCAACMLLVFRAVDAQLGKSLPDGTRQVRRDTVKITVRTLADTDAQLLESADTCALILRLGAVVRELSAARLALRDAENELRVLSARLAAARREAADARANLAQWQSARPT